MKSRGCVLSCECYTNTKQGANIRKPQLPPEKVLKSICIYEPCKIKSAHELCIQRSTPSTNCNRKPMHLEIFGFLAGTLIVKIAWHLVSQHLDRLLFSPDSATCVFHLNSTCFCMNYWQSHKFILIRSFFQHVRTLRCIHRSLYDVGAVSDLDRSC